MHQMASKTQPIGIFDSGVGGLTVLKEVATLLPSEDIVYLGDTARVPYGTRSPKTIIRYSERNAEFLLRQGVKLLVVACNTSSAVSLKVLKAHNKVPIIGVIEPSARKAVELTRTGRIGVIGTESTIKSGAYQEAIRLFSKGQVEVFAQACPLFVPLAEEGWTEDYVTKLVAQRYLEPLKEKGIDVLVLGCTHYPLLSKVIAEVMGPEVKLVSSAEETALEVKKTLEEHDLINPQGKGQKKFFVTDNPERFRSLAEIFLGCPINDEVFEVDL